MDKMRKDISFIACVVLAVALAQFVSASFLGDLFGNINGRTTDVQIQPTNAPTVNTFCASPSGESKALLQWSGGTPLDINGPSHGRYWIAISQGFTANGNDYYGRDVGTSPAAEAPTNFVLHSQSSVNSGAYQTVQELKLVSGQQYTVWIWNGVNSESRTFTAKDCPNSQPTSSTSPTTTTPPALAIQPTSAPSVNTFCSSPTGESKALLQWSGGTPLDINGPSHGRYWIAISQGFTANHADYYGRDVGTSPAAEIPTNFILHSQSSVNSGAYQTVSELKLVSGQQYTVWIWNGQNSQPTSFTAKICSNLSTAPPSTTPTTPTTPPSTTSTVITPTNVPSVNLFCSSSIGESKALLQWSGGTPLDINGPSHGRYWIAISQGSAANGNDYYGRDVGTSPAAEIPTGFVLHTQSNVNNGEYQTFPELKLISGQQYTVWIWNGANSESRTFTAMNCPNSQPTSSTSPTIPTGEETINPPVITPPTTPPVACTAGQKRCVDNDPTRFQICGENEIWMDSYCHTNEKCENGNCVVPAVRDVCEANSIAPSIKIGKTGQTACENLFGSDAKCAEGSVQFFTWGWRNAGCNDKRPWYTFSGTGGCCTVKCNSCKGLPPVSTR